MQSSKGIINDVELAEEYEEIIKSSRQNFISTINSSKIDLTVACELKDQIYMRIKNYHELIDIRHRIKLAQGQDKARSNRSFDINVKITKQNEYKEHDFAERSVKDACIVLERVLEMIEWYKS